MPTEAIECRRAKRWEPKPTESLSRLRLRTGRELGVINLSVGGALVQGETRLLPGTHVDVHVTTAQGRVLARARVLRCAVWTVTADVIQYRGALAFNSPVEIAPAELTPGEPHQATLVA